MNLSLSDRIALSGDLTNHREEDWLVYGSTLGARFGAAASFEQLLAWNHTLAGAAKFGLSPELEPVLQAQLPLRDYHSPHHAALAAATAEGIGVARLLWQESFPSTVNWPARLATQPAAAELFDACGEAGWPAKTDAAAVITVDLGGNGCWQYAHVATLAGSGGTLLEVDFVAMRDPEPTTLRAVSQLFLLLGGMLRWARPFLRRQDDVLAGGFQIHVPGVPTPSELDDALCIFAVAGEVWGREITALLNPAAARDYLTATAPDPFV